MHHYPFHVGDYAGHTQHLDEIEDLAYRRMLDYVYLNEINLPESVEEIARLIRMRTHCERIATVLREFFKLENGEWINKRAVLEITKYKTKSAKASESAGKRWKKCDANALPTQSESNANQNQNQNQNQQTIIAGAIAPSDDMVELPVDFVQDGNGRLVYKYRGDDPRAQPKKQNKGHRLPDDWILPRAAGEWALSEGLTREQVLREAERFKDYWHSKPGREGTKTDWAAPWRNWIRKAADDMARTGKRAQGGASMFTELHTDRSWADGLSFIEKHTDPTWRAGL